MIELTSAERRALRARAHALHPVVFIGDKGLSAGVEHEIGNSLDTHELIKIKVADADREARDALMVRICEDLGAAPVQHIGKILVIYRPAPEQANTVGKRSKPARKRRTKRQFQAD